MFFKHAAAAALGAAIIAAAPASAAAPATAPVPVNPTFDFTNTGSTSNTSVTVNGVSVYATGWTVSNLNSSTMPTLANVYAWQGTGAGLGVSYVGEADVGGRINQHTVDNMDSYDFVALYFSRAVSLTGMKLNGYSLSTSQSGSDTDNWVSYGTYSGALPTTVGGIQAAMNSMWVGSNGLLANGREGKDGALSTALASKLGNVWIIGASRSDTQRNDGFKIASITASVPEPATWATMMLGFGLAGAAMRRRRTSVAVAA